MIGANQSSAGRALLGISAAELSEKSNVPHRTVQRLETADGIPPSRGGTLERIKQALEAEGIEFIGDAIASPGVRLHAKKSSP